MNFQNQDEFTEFLALFADFSIQGTLYFYYQNNQLRKMVPHVNYVIDGEVIIFSEDGSCSDTIRYVQGVKHGFHFQYYENQQPKKISQYVNGIKQNLERIYCSSGNIFAESWFLDGQLHGSVTTFYDQIIRQPSGIMQYAFGQRHGSYVNFYQNGNVSLMCTYVNDQLDGPRISFDINGYITNREHFQLDVLISAVQGIQQVHRTAVTQDPDLTGIEKCPICFLDQHEMQHPIGLMCDNRHVFCESCIENLVNVTLGQVVCPLCKIPIQTI